MEVAAGPAPSLWPPELAVAALVGLVVYLLVTLLVSLRRHAAPGAPARAPKAPAAPNEPSHEPLKDKACAVSPVAKQGKKKSSTWKNKSNFNHQFLATSLMGHSGKILGMDCTADSKYLVTCADDERPADLGDGSSSGSEASKENRSPSESPTGSSPGSPSGSRRSARRRRKPRPTRELRAAESASPPPPPASLCPLPRYAQMRLSEQDLAGLLNRYLLNKQQLSSLGYPIEDTEDPARAIIIATDFPTPARPFDVNAREFVPRRMADSSHQNRDYDSGRGSGSSSPRSGSSSPRSTDSDPEEDDRIKNSMERKCARCTRAFFITSDGEYVTRERCLHHWGRLKRDPHTSLPIEWACCGGPPNDPGCSRAPLHVWSGTSAGVNGPLEGYVRTRPRIPGAPRRCILALDCEMIYTAAGLQVAQVEVVAADGRRVYTTYVRPDAPIIDYNTRFSGISPRHLQKTTKTLQDVQRELLNIIDAETILVGHGLENDLRALRLLHNRVVDTAVSFAHPRGLPFRMSLKHLASVHLHIEVQKTHHSPVEDARVSLDLMLMRIQNDFVFPCQK